MLRTCSVQDTMNFIPQILIETFFPISDPIRSACDTTLRETVRRKNMALMEFVFHKEKIDNAIKVIKN